MSRATRLGRVVYVGRGDVQENVIVEMREAHEVR